MDIFEQVLSYLHSQGFSRQLTYAQFSVLPADRRRGLFVHVMPGRRHFCVCQIPQVVQSVGEGVGSESFAFLSVRDGDIDPIELKHEAALRAMGAELVEYEATIAIQPEAEDEADDVEVDTEAGEGAGVEGEESDSSADEVEAEFDAEDWAYNLAAVDEYWPERVSEGARLPFVKSLDQLKAHPLFATEMFDALAVHIARCVPEGFSGHGRVWSVSAMSTLTKGYDDVTLLGVHINGFDSLEFVATAADSGQPPFLVLLTIKNGVVDDRDMAAMEKIAGFQFLKSKPEADEIGFGCVALPGLDGLAQAMQIPGVIRAARLAAIRMTEEKPGKKRPQPASNLAALDAVSARGRPAILANGYPSAVEEYVEDAKLDSAWLPDGDYLVFMLSLATRAAEGDKSAETRLLEESNRSYYRAPWARRLAAQSVLAVIGSDEVDHAEAYAICRGLLKSKMPEMLANAVLWCCHLAPPVEGKSFDTPLSFLRQINGQLELLAVHHDVDIDTDVSYNLEGAIFAGVLFTADIQIMPMLESAWHRLSRQAKVAVFELRPKAVSFAYLDFVFARLQEVADTDDSICGEIIRHLRDLPAVQDIPAIDDRLFWFNEPERGYLYANDIGENAREEMCYAEYLRENRDMIDGIADIENKPRMVPELIREWRLLTRADLERRRAEKAAESED